jgi:hypothetical protein
MVGLIPGMSGPLLQAGLVVLVGRCWPAGRSLETPGLDHPITVICVGFQLSNIKSIDFQLFSENFSTAKNALKIEE